MTVLKEIGASTANLNPEHLCPNPGIVLTPIGEKLARGEIVQPEDFFQEALPPWAKMLSPFCASLIWRLNEEIINNVDDPYNIFSIRGSAVRRASWKLALERSGVPIADYWSITPWWKEHFNASPLDDNAGQIEQKAAVFLQEGPLDIDFRLEYADFGRKAEFKALVNDKFPVILQEIFRNSNLAGFNLKQIMYITIGANIPGRDDLQDQYLGNIYEIRDADNNLLLKIDIGNGNAVRENIFTAHNHGEPSLLVSNKGLALQPKYRDNKLFTNLFDEDYLEHFTANLGAQGFNIITIGSRMCYFGASFHQAPYPNSDSRMLGIIKKFKMVYQKKFYDRIPEIISNLIVALMTDPRYTFACLRQADYFRQFPLMASLADDEGALDVMEREITARLSPQYFQGRVWNPFIFIDALNAAGANMDRSFSSLCKLFNPGN